MAIQDTVDQIIVEARDNAKSFSDQAQDAVDLAIQSAQTLAVPAAPDNTSSIDSVGDLVDPLAPAQDYVQIFRDAQDALKDEILSSSNEDFNEFVNKYFPLTLNAVQVAWLENVILNGDAALPQDIEDAMYNRNIDRINEEMQKGKDEAIERYSQFGWADPPGSLSKRISMIQQEARMKACEAARDIMINQADRAEKNVQFAIDQATRLQDMVWKAADGFSQSVTRAIGPAVQSGAGQAEAARSFYDQTLQYYRTILAAKEMVLQQERGEQDVRLKLNDQAIRVINERATRMTEAALGASKVLGDMSAASLAGQNTMASLVVEEVTSS